MPANRESPESAMEPIAIVGMACRLPGGIDSASSLWMALKEKRTMRTAKVPANRFNIDAYLHENNDRPGSFNVPGGYFLDGNLEDFDPSFFNMSPVEAMWLDPQQRKMLEVTYECFESAGVPVDALTGSNTGVFVGCFTADYQQMSFKEADFRHSYAATGVDPGIISTRIGNVFDLRGPNQTLNTACSSAIYAIHQACTSLRARDCNAAVAGGVNLILTVDQHMNTAKLGVLSPTSTCHTFDVSADGYGRAEGAGALYLKRLSDALRDGDPVRAVIRGSAVNSNGKVPSYGITYPSIRGQEAVVRAAYARSGLDPRDTAYVEAHGTGTPVGDPIEAQAIASAMNDNRPADKPLIVGALKPTIGHSEAASGIFAVMKAALMTETATITGIYGLQTVNPAIREEEWNIKIPKDTVAWQDDGHARRAGVSSFGYGGTNGHVIVEEATGIADRCRTSGRHAGAGASYTGAAAARPYLVGFAAHDRRTLERNVAAHATVAADVALPDLAHTLLTRRSRFSVRGFAVATQDTVTAALQDPAALTVGTAPAAAPELGYVFTGQGAQWPALGAAAMDAFPSFRATVRALDAVLQGLPFARPAWTLEAALHQPAGKANRINEAEISQPVCTAVQIAIVDLFAEWGFQPKATVGHSSGEIAAAYAAGFISGPEAIVAAYLRGYAVAQHATVGSMLAVGLGAKEAAACLPDNGEVVVACQNSPASTTLSGSAETIAALAATLQARQVFARELPTGRAYHSHHMTPVGLVYDDLLARATASLSEASKEAWMRPRITWISSVTGFEFTEARVPPTYWSRNLCGRVLFDEAVATLAKHHGLARVRAMVEIGPHPALSGPFKQTCQALELPGFTYTASLVRNKDGAEQLLGTAGALFLQNYPLDVRAVNATGDPDQPPRVLVDLPPYQWNYEKTYWAEPRFSQEQRHPTHGRHDLLGSRVFGLSDRSMVWKNYLRHRDIPWLKDHKLGNEEIFPAAAHMSMAAEALWQVCDGQGTAVESVTFRDTTFSVALAIPESEDGIETQLRFEALEDGWHKFSVQSWAEGEWNVHCEGLVAANQQVRKSPAPEHPVDAAQLTQRVAAKHWYGAFHKVGFEYGPSFQAMHDLRTNSALQQATGRIDVATQSTIMTGESRYLLHPSTIDACLHLVIVSINAGRYREMQHGVVPIQFEEITVFRQAPDARAAGRAVGWCHDQVDRYFDCGAQLVDAAGELILDGRNLRCVAYEAAVPPENHARRAREPHMQTVWRPDITTLGGEAALRALPAGLSEPDAMAAIVELCEHKSHLEKSLVLGDVDTALLRTILAKTSSLTAVVVANSSKALMPEEDVLQLPDNVLVSTATSDAGWDWEGALAGPHDVAVVKLSSVATQVEVLKQVASHLVQDGRAVFSLAADEVTAFGSTLWHAGFTGIDFQLVSAGGQAVVSTTYVGDLRNGVFHGTGTLVVVKDGTAPSGAWCDGERLGDSTIEQHDIADALDLTRPADIIVDDTAGTLLASLTEARFATLKALLTGERPVVWLTRGVNAGDAGDAGALDAAMCAGLLRAVRSERAAARLLWLDVDAAASDEAVAAALAGHLGHVPAKAAGADAEFWLRADGAEYVPRVIPHDALNRQFAAGDPAAPAQEMVLAAPAAGEALRGKMLEGELVFSTRKHQPLGPHDVRLQVEYSVGGGQFTLVCGTVIAAASGLDETSTVGRRAVDLVAGNVIETAVALPWDHCVPLVGEGETDEAGLVGSLPALARALYAVQGAAHVQPREHVLLVPAGDVAAAAAVARLGRALQFDLTVVASTSAEQDALVRCGDLTPDTTLVADDAGAVYAALARRETSVDVIVVVGGFGRFAQELWRRVPGGARFVLEGAAPGRSPDAVPLARGASFLSVALDHLVKRQPARMPALLRDALALARAGSLPPTSLPALTDISAAATVKPTAAVFKYDYGTSQVKVQPAEKTISLSPDVAYLLVGCLGGLGRSLTTMMMERGARDFVFLSRSGADKPEAAALVASLQAAGAKTTVYRGDAAVRADVDSVVGEVTRTRRIGGVVHAAMVLQDGLFDSLTLDQFRAAVAPKAAGAKTLHEALEALEAGGVAGPDFFILTSSISATMGNPGQANYAAANSYLDALAWHRRGRRTIALVLPMVLGVGVVAENAGIEAALAKKAMYGIDEREMLRGFETAMLQGSAGGDPTLGDCQLILGLEPAFLAAAIHDARTGEEPYWYGDARFGGLRAVVDALLQERAGGAGSGAGAGGANMAAALRVAPADAAVEAACGFVAKKLSTMLLVPAEEFRFDGQSVGSYGLDSMVGADLRNWLFNQFGLQIGGFHATYMKMLPPQHFVDVQDAARLHVAAAIHPDVVSERIFGFAAPYNGDLILDIFRKMHPNKTFPENFQSGQDLYEVVPRARAEQLLRDLGQGGWTTLEQSLKWNTEDLE